MADIVHLARLAELLVVRSHFSLFPFKNASPGDCLGSSPQGELLNACRIAGIDKEEAYRQSAHGCFFI